MKAHSARLFGRLNRRNSDPATPAVKKCFDGVRSGRSNSSFQNLKFISASSLPSETTRDCGVVFIVLPTEQPAVRLAHDATQWQERLSTVNKRFSIRLVEG